MPAAPHEKALSFRALHEAPGAFVIPNVWDGGSASLMSGLGFGALATSSSAAAATLGKLDGGLTRAEALAHAALIASLTALPLSPPIWRTASVTRRRSWPRRFALRQRADSSAPRSRMRAGMPARLSTSSITPLHGSRRRCRRHAVRRFHSRSPRVRKTSCTSGADLTDTVRRLQAFERAGADVLFAPGLPDLEAVRSVCAALKKPVNFMVGMRGQAFSLAELTAAGVKRISLSTTLYRAAMTGVFAAGTEARAGRFGYVGGLMSGGDLGRYLRQQAEGRTPER